MWLLDTVSLATKPLGDITNQHWLLWCRKWQWHFVFWGWEMCWNICCSCERYRPPPPHTRTHTHAELPPVQNVSQEATLSWLTSRWQTDSRRNDLAGWPQRGHSYIDRHIISTLPYLLPALPSVRNETIGRGFWDFRTRLSHPPRSSPENLFLNIVLTNIVIVFLFLFLEYHLS